VSKAQTRVDFAYSYITLYLVIEIINRRYHSEIMDEYFKNRLDGDESFEQLGEWSKIAVLYIGRWKQEDVRFLRHLNFLMQNRNNFIHNNHAYLDKRDAYGRYINHYIYNAGGSIKLLSAIEHIIELMANYEE
jgi:hypothetical protein